MQIDFTILEARYKACNKMAQGRQILPFVGGTIPTQLSTAFVVVAFAERVSTRNIQENVTHRTFLLHTGP